LSVSAIGGWQFSCYDAHQPVDRSVLALRLGLLAAAQIDVRRGMTPWAALDDRWIT
jgi:hypothetical protein